MYSRIALMSAQWVDLQCDISDLETFIKRSFNKRQDFRNRFSKDYIK